MPKFVLNGREMECRTALGAGQLMKLAKAMKGDKMSQLAGMYDFLSAVVVVEARATLDAVLDDVDDFDALNEAIGDLMMAFQEQTPARPTKRSSPSPSPQTPRGGTSRAASSSPDKARVVRLSSKAGLSAAS